MTKRTEETSPADIVRLRPDERAALAALAKATGRRQEDLAHEALGEYLAVHHAHGEAIRHGIAEADAGLFVSDDDVKAWTESLGTPQERPPPRAR